VKITGISPGGSNFARGKKIWGQDSPMVLFQDFYHPPHIVVYQYIIILFSPEWCLIRSSQEDLPGELFIFHFPFIYYSPVPVALGYVT